MKRLLLLFVGILFLVPAAGADEPADLFARGVNAYEAGNYDEALRSFESILETGRVSPALYYNLGNCYYRLGSRGHAVWAYERAHRLDPRDADIRHNLRLLRRQSADAREKPVRLPGIGLFYRALDRVKTDELAILLASGIWLLAAGLAAYALWPAGRPRLKKALMFLLVYTVLAGFLAGARYAQIKDLEGVILEPEVYVRYGPSEEATRAFVLHEGARVTIANESKGWYFIKFGPRQGGWVPKQVLVQI